MDRLKQIRTEVLQKFFKKHNRMPNEKELKELLLKQGEYTPISQPMVPLYNAKSIAEYTRSDLLDIIKDRSLIEELLTATSEEIDRVDYASNAEAVNILTKAELLLTDHQDNTFKNIYDSIAMIPGEADVSNWYLKASGVDDMYIEDDGVSSDPSYIAQFIELNSFNVESGKEGISISPSTSSKLAVSLTIAPYSETDYAVLQTLSEKDPISIVASGLPNINKGIELNIPINDRRISIVKLDTNAITCSVLVDDTQLFTKALDGPTILSIGSHVKDSIKIRLYDTTAQVNVVIRDLSVYTSGETAAGNYDYGQYISLEIPVNNKYGNLLFNPDEYQPEGTSIDWYWSNSRITWYPMSKLDSGAYELSRPDESLWNTELKTMTTINGSEVLGLDDEHGFKYIGDIETKGNLLDYTVKMGKGCVLFVTKDNPHSQNPYGFTFNGFLFYLEVTDDTGYTLELTNPYTNEGQNIFSNISIESKDNSISEPAQSSIKFDLAKGIHKVQLELAPEIIFNFEPDEDGFGTDFSSPDANFKYGVMNRLLNEYGASLNWSLGDDRLGRQADVWVEPYGVDEYDKHIACVNRNFILTGTAKLDAMPVLNPELNEQDNIRTNKSRIFAKKLNLGKTYELIPINAENYTQTTAAHSGYEIHYYAGDGNADWQVDMYHTPVGDVTLNENATDYTPVGDTVTIPLDQIASTVTDSKEFLKYKGSDPEVSFDLQQIPISQAVTLTRHNIVDNIDLDPVEGIDENFISFFPAGRAVETFTSNGTDIQTPAALTYRPTSGYCLINDEYIQGIVEAANCTNGTWVEGYCSNGSSLTLGDCLEAGSCSGYETVTGTVDEIQPTDKTTCETALSGGTAGTWTSTSTWTKYMMVTSENGNTEYTIDSFDYSTNVLTISGLTGTNASTIKIFYDYNEFQSNQTQFNHIQTHQISSTNEIILLDREIYNPSASLVKVLAPGDITGVDLTPTLDANLNRYYVDLSNYSSGSDPLAVEDNITLQYKIEPTISVDSNILTIVNIPNTLTVRKVNKEYGTTLVPSAATTLTMEHPVAFRELPGADSGPNSNLYIEIDGTHMSGYCTGFDTDGDGTPDSTQPTTKTACETDPDGAGAGTAGTWTNIVQGIEGNVITMDLSQYTAQDDAVQESISVMVIYESYEHDTEWKLEVDYTYYKQVGYSFNYAYNKNRWATPEEMWVFDAMRNYFFDISYRESVGDDLYLKATLTSDTGVESPIIRRLRFEQQ